MKTCKDLLHLKTIPEKTYSRKLWIEISKDCRKQEDAKNPPHRKYMPEKKTRVSYEYRLSRTV